MNTVKPLPFDPSKLRGLSERLIVSHHENNYGGAVKNLNLTEEELARVTKDTTPLLVAALKVASVLPENTRRRTCSVVRYRATETGPAGRLRSRVQAPRAIPHLQRAGGAARRAARGRRRARGLHDRDVSRSCGHRARPARGRLAGPPLCPGARIEACDPVAQGADRSELAARPARVRARARPGTRWAPL